MQEYVFFFILLLVAVGFVAVMIGINLWIGFKARTSPVKQEPFECGSPPFHQQGERVFQVKYTTVALLFLMFDLEAILLYPWAVSAREVGEGAIAGGLFFLSLLVLALLYVWRKGLLEWH
jgi:NADH-quinone oxidoreductase subunit A